ncbi:putative reverse transcriptase domain-containing protein [Tanacetum coccineum]
MVASPSLNHVFNFPSNEPHDFDDSDLKFEEDPQEEFKEDPQEDPKEEPEEEPETKMTIEGGHVQRVAREGTRVENVKLKRELEAAEISNTLLRIGLERTERELYRLRAWTYDFNKEMVQTGVVVVRPGEAIDVLAVYGEYQPSKPTMPPRRLKHRAVERMVQKRVDEAIAEYERNRTNPENAEGTEGVVGLRRWIEKVEQVFEISKCAEEDKVKFAASTFEGRALTWWNGNVYTLGLVNANRIPWNEFKAMMTTEYCLATKIQMMEQELWTLTLKCDNIEGYNNRFHELALMCPELVTPEKKKIERYIRGLPERIKANVTSSNPANITT